MFQPSRGGGTAMGGGVHKIVIARKNDLQERKRLLVAGIAGMRGSNRSHSTASLITLSQNENWVEGEREVTETKTQTNHMTVNTGGEGKG